MATMGACRLLLVCVFCTLWGGAVMATELSSANGKNSYLLQKAQEVEAGGGGGEKAVKAQADVKVRLADYLRAFIMTKRKSESKDEDKVKNLEAAITQLTTLQTEATKLNDTAYEVTTAVEEAAKEEGTADLWATAKTEAKAQFDSTNNILKIVKKAKEDAEKVKGEVDALTNDDAKKQKATEALTKLSEDLEDIVKEEGDLEILIPKAEKEIKQAAADASKKQAVQKTPGLTDQTNSEDNLSQGSQQNQGSSEEAENQTTNGNNDKATENTTPNKSGEKLSTDGLNKEKSTSADTKDKVITETLDASEITAWAASPLFLLLTAAAYAAMC